MIKAEKVKGWGKSYFFFIIRENGNGNWDNFLCTVPFKNLCNNFSRTFPAVGEYLKKTLKNYD